MKSSWSSEIGGSSADPKIGSGQPSFVRGLATLSGMATLVLVVGFLRNAVIAAVYGASADKDAYDVAAGVPQWLLYLFGLDLLRSLCGAIFARLDARKDDDPSEVLSSILTVMIVVGGSVMAVGMVTAPWLVKLLGPGLHGEKAALCCTLLRMLLPSLMLMAALGLFSSVLNAYHRYAMAELGNLVLRVFVLVVVLVAGRFFQIHLLAVTVLAGLVLAVGLQWVSLRRLGFRYRPSLSLRSGYVREAARGALPLMLAMIIGQTGDLYLRRLITYSQDGVVASYGYAAVIYSLSIALLARPVAQTFAPRIGRYAGLEAVAAGRELFGRSFRLVWLLVVGTLLVVVACAPSVVAVVFRRGAFDAHAVELTSCFLGVMIWGALGQSASLLCMRCYYAFGRSWRVLAAIACRDAVRIPLAAIGFKFLGPVIVPTAVAVGALVEGMAGLLLVRSLLRGTGIGWFRWLPRYLVTAGLGGLVAFLVAGSWAYDDQAGFWYHAVGVGLTGTSVVVTMFVVGWLVGLSEIRELSKRARPVWQWLIERLRR